jgi:small nuclear ribonucleoprotein (snRNP)-like protein
MIRVRVILVEGQMLEGEFEDFDACTFWILKQSINIRTMEIDVENSVDKFPPFWHQE